eukprot:s766_g5.t1
MGPTENNILNGDRRKDGCCPRQQFSSRDINVMLRYHNRSLGTPSLPARCSKAAELPGGFNSDTFFSPKVGLSGNVNSRCLPGSDVKLRSLVVMDQLEYFNQAADTAIWSASSQNMTERQAIHSMSGNVES